MKWPLRILGYLWALPQTLVGFLIALLVYRAHGWRWSDGCWECVAPQKKIWGHPAGQTHGWLIVYKSEEIRLAKHIRVHERVHVIQNFLLGPCFPLAYGAHFLWNWLRAPKEDRFNWAYRRVWAEIAANEIQREFVSGKVPGAWGA